LKERGEVEWMPNLQKTIQKLPAPIARVPDACIAIKKGAYWFVPLLQNVDIARAKGASIAGLPDGQG
jgi:hypothetical protein